VSVRHSRESSRSRRAVYDWAMRKLSGRLDAAEARTADSARRGRGLAYLLVGRFVASDLGLQKTRKILVTGGPVAGRDARFFWALGIPLLETYGQAELGGLAYAHTSLDDAGTIGKPLPGISGRISDGELEISSPAIAGEAWHPTGDLAEDAGDERIRVRGRREDVIHAPDGDIVVAGLEAALGESTYIRHAVVAAIGGSELTALVEVDYEETLAWATARDLHFSTYGSLVSSDEVAELVAAEVAAANDRLGASAKIAEFIVLPRQLTIRDGELTPRLAIRRRAVIDRFIGDPAVKRAPVAPRAEASTAS
jgi:long-chain acyl-CoA synthetase